MKASARLHPSADSDAFTNWIVQGKSRHQCEMAPSSRRPIHENRKRARLSRFERDPNEKPRAGGINVIRAEIWCGDSNAGQSKERLRLVRIERAVGAHGHRHQRAIRLKVEQFGSVSSPMGIGPSGDGDLPLMRFAADRLHEHFRSVAGLERRVRQPVAVG